MDTKEMIIESLESAIQRGELEATKLDSSIRNAKNQLMELKKEPITLEEGKTISCRLGVESVRAMVEQAETFVPKEAAFEVRVSGRKIIFESSRRTETEALNMARAVVSVSNGKID